MRQILQWKSTASRFGECHVRTTLKFLSAVYLVPVEAVGVSIKLVSGTLVFLSVTYICTCSVRLWCRSFSTWNRHLIRLIERSCGLFYWGLYRRNSFYSDVGMWITELEFVSRSIFDSCEGGDINSYSEYKSHAELYFECVFATSKCKMMLQYWALSVPNQCVNRIFQKVSFKVTLHGVVVYSMRCVCVHGRSDWFSSCWGFSAV